jgi:starvation-inducible DNA-binding protein
LNTLGCSATSVFLFGGARVVRDRQGRTRWIGPIQTVRAMKMTLRTQNGSIEHFKKENLMRLQPTSHDLSEPLWSNVLGLLNSRLADCRDLQTQTRQAPCHVKGPYFSGLHTLFDDINEDVEHNLETIAERAAHLGGALERTIRAVAAKSSLLENPVTPSSGRDHVTALADTLASFRRNVWQAIGQANEAGDTVTAGVFIQVSRGIDKWLWMVQANLQEG